ncbi:MAG TPA: aminotransferase class I/II-fold pyridoxal phosphate-dependent enzyme, partial [Chitinispirillaceae bacterium]|nr:aminotransferase class I/II-fold pyridoxal phosphate-dependent enzyme [Chitinispirillaceae bacterium]
NYMSTKLETRLFLSPPHMSGKELQYIEDAFASNWIAPAGPDIQAFEKSVCEYTGATNAVALSSGTAAIHLALLVSRIGVGDDVFCSTFTFAGSVFPVTYCGAKLVLIDSEQKSWNMDPELLSEAIENSKRKGRVPKAVIAVHLYGQSANVGEIKTICEKNNLICIEDAAESLGTYCQGLHTGTIGDFGIFSFNGNKIITTSGGGMLIGKSAELIERARFLSTQARDPFPYYHHTNIGYNYRLSNVLAAIGRGQISVIEERVQRRRELFEFYSNAFKTADGITMIPIDTYGRSNCWLSCILIDYKITKKTPEDLRIALEQQNIESRPLWKPMHLQPVFKSMANVVNGTSESLFNCGLCLPSGSQMSDEDLDRVANNIKKIINNSL